MARASQGNFYFIQSINDATEVFSIELDSLRAVVGQNLQATLELAPGVSLVDTLSLAQVSQNSQGQTLLTLGELYEGEDKLLGLSLSVNKAARLGDLPLLQLHYSADVLSNNVITGVTGNAAVIAQVGTAEAAALAFSSQVVLELTRLNIAKAKEVALSLAEQGKHADGELVLRVLSQQLRDRGLDETFEIAEEIEQLEYFAERIAQKALGNAGRKELKDQSYQGMTRNRSDLAARGVTAGAEVLAMPVATEVGEGVELVCVREGGKLRIKVVSEGYDGEKNVQFPRAIRAEGARYVATSLELSADGSFYRVKGEIKRFTQPGEVDTWANYSSPRQAKSTAKAAKGPASAADLPTTDEVGEGILVQCIKEGSKLRARVVSDGYEPDWNIRFPRSVREEGMLYVVEEIRLAPDGKSYIACGDIKRLLQPTNQRYC
jgi:Ca-activated chloride channel family protein